MYLLVKCTIREGECPFSEKTGEVSAKGHTVRCDAQHPFMTIHKYHNHFKFSLLSVFVICINK